MVSWGFSLSAPGGPPLPPTGEVASARAPDGEAAQLACRASLGWGWGLGFGWVAWALAWLDSGLLVGFGLDGLIPG